MSHARSRTDATRQLAALKRRLEKRRRIQKIEVAIHGAAVPFRILLPANPDSVLDEMSVALVSEAAGGDGGPAMAPEAHMPYWATPWASGLALAEVALADADTLCCRRVLELGSGLGVTAAAATQVGARLTVADCFAESLAYCRANALANASRAPRSLLADWRLPEGRALLVGAGPFSAVLAADVLYEPDDVAPLLELIPALLVPGGEFWLAEPGRATSATFVVAAREAGWRELRTDYLERDWPAGAGHARVAVRRYAVR